MCDVNPAASNEWFDDTISCCTSDKLQKDDETLLYLVYEEFDSDSWTFLHENTLNILLEGGYIDKEIFKLAGVLRVKSVKLLSSDAERSAEYVRTNEHWREIMDLCDLITLKKKTFISRK